MKIDYFNCDVDKEVEIITAKLHCPFLAHGCFTQVTLLTFEAHKLDCMYRPIKCENGCGFESVSLTDHSKKDCISEFKKLVQVSTENLERANNLAEQIRGNIESLMLQLDYVTDERDGARIDFENLLVDNQNLVEGYKDMEKENEEYEEVRGLKQKIIYLKSQNQYLVSFANSLRDIIITNPVNLQRKLFQTFFYIIIS